MSRSQPRMRLLAGTGCTAAVLLVACTAVLGLHSPMITQPAVFVPLRAMLCLGLVAVAATILWRRSSDRLAASLVAIALMLTLTGLTAADSPLLFTIGRLAIPLSILATIHFFMTYPNGRIDARWASVVFVAAAGVLIILDVASVLVSWSSPLVGPFVRCATDDCPASPISIIDLGRSIGDGVSTALALASSLIASAAAIHVAVRARRAGRLQRHRLAPLLPWGLPAALGYALFVGVEAIDHSAGWLMPAAVIVAAVLSAMPLALALGIASGRASASAALRQTVARLAVGCTPACVQRTMSLAFADPTLRLLSWQPEQRRYADIEGNLVEPAALPRTAQLSTFAQGHAVVHDRALSHDRDILETGALAASLALDGPRLDDARSTPSAALASVRHRIAAAADAERQRIERDLHDGLQQELIALAIRLKLLEELAAEDPAAVVAGLADAGRRTDAAIAHVRDLATGIYPSTLRDFGLRQALTAVARTLPFELTLRIETRRRYPLDVETAVYFSCLEALQNIAKHCGADTRAHLRLFECAAELHVVIADDGPGFDPARHLESRGITHMHDRLEAVGGTLTVRSAPGSGTTITATVPVAPA